MRHDGEMLRAKTSKKGDPRMPFQIGAEDVMTGYLYPEIHKGIKKIKGFRTRKN